MCGTLQGPAEFADYLIREWRLEAVSYDALILLREWDFLQLRTE